MRVRELMTGDLFLGHERDPVSEIARIMREKEVGLVPIVDRRDRLTGVLTDRDLAIRVVARAVSTARTLAYQVMTTGPFVTCLADDDLAVAEARMAAARKSRIVVTDGYEHPLGVVSLADIARAGAAAGAGRLLREVARRESPL